MAFGCIPLVMGTTFLLYSFRHERKTELANICGACGKPFVPTLRHPDQRYCSARCFRRVYQKNRQHTEKWRAYNADFQRRWRLSHPAEAGKQSRKAYRARMASGYQQRYNRAYWEDKKDDPSFMEKRMKNMHNYRQSQCEQCGGWVGKKSLAKGFIGRELMLCHACIVQQPTRTVLPAEEEYRTVSHIVLNNYGELGRLRRIEMAKERIWHIPLKERWR